jgi:hypothetical protein
MPDNETDAAWITRVLDVTGNLKATQEQLGHASIQIPGDAYADWDIDQFADTMRVVLEGKVESFPPTLQNLCKIGG